MTLIKIYQLLDQPNSNGVVHPKELHREFMKTQIGKAFPITLCPRGYRGRINDVDDWVDPCIVGEATITDLDENGIPIVSVDLDGTLLDYLLDGTYVLTSTKSFQTKARKAHHSGRVSVVGSYDRIISFDIALKVTCNPNDSWDISYTTQTEDLYVVPPTVKDRLTTEVSELTRLRNELLELLCDYTATIATYGEAQYELMKQQPTLLNDYITILQRRIDLL